MKKESRLERVVNPLIRSFPLAVLLSIVAFTGAHLITSYEVSRIADLNKNGVVSEKEWFDLYKKESIEYPLRKPLLSLNQKGNIIKNYWH